MHARGAAFFYDSQANHCNIVFKATPSISFAKVCIWCFASLCFAYGCVDDMHEAEEYFIAANEEEDHEQGLDERMMNT